MKNNKAVKILTLLGFILLLASFIAFKAGTFDKAPVHIKEPTGPMPVDTPPARKTDTLKTNPAMLPTTKSIILYEPQIKFLKDTFRLKRDSLTLRPKR